MGAERSGRQQDLGVAVAQLLCEFAGRGEGAERHHHRTDAGRGQHADEELRAVGIQQADVGALARTEGDQAARQASGPAFCLPVVEAVGVADQQRVRWAVDRPAPQHGGDGVRLSHGRR